VYERFKKIEKKRSKGEIKIQKGPGGNDPAQLQIEPTAHFPTNPKRYPSPLSLSLPGGTRMSASSPPPFPLFSLETELAGVTPPLISRE
jgi:hypothetical protein